MRPWVRSRLTAPTVPQCCPTSQPRTRLCAGSVMTDQEPTELMILFRIVEVLERKMMGDVPDEVEGAATGNIANVVNTFIASSPNFLFSTSREGAIMGDNYTTGQAGSVGPDSSAYD